LELDLLPLVGGGVDLGSCVDMGSGD
jgi:hypothetical protein